MKFRKKPVVIEARRFDGSWLSGKDILDWIEPGWNLTESEHRWVPINGGELLIKTLEGIMTASADDMIIQGIAGEFYPCKANIFKATYEAVTE